MKNDLSDFFIRGTAIPVKLLILNGNVVCTDWSTCCCRNQQRIKEIERNNE